MVLLAFRSPASAGSNLRTKPTKGSEQRFPEVDVGLAVWTAQELVSPNGSILGIAACVRLPVGSGTPVGRHVLFVVFKMSRRQACRRPRPHRDDAWVGVADGHDRLRVFGQAYEGLLEGALQLVRDGSPGRAVAEHQVGRIVLLLGDTLECHIHGAAKGLDGGDCCLLCALTRQECFPEPSRGHSRPAFQSVTEFNQQIGKGCGVRSTPEHSLGLYPL